MHLGLELLLELHSLEDVRGVLDRLDCARGRTVDSNHGVRIPSSHGTGVNILGDVNRDRRVDLANSGLGDKHEHRVGEILRVTHDLGRGLPVVPSLDRVNHQHVEGKIGVGEWPGIIADDDAVDLRDDATLDPVGTVPRYLAPVLVGFHGVEVFVERRARLGSVSAVPKLPLALLLLVSPRTMRLADRFLDCFPVVGPVLGHRTRPAGREQEALRSTAAFFQPRLLRVRVPVQEVDLANLRVVVRDNLVSELPIARDPRLLDQLADDDVLRVGPPGRLDDDGAEHGQVEHGLGHRSVDSVQSEVVFQQPRGRIGLGGVLIPDRLGHDVLSLGISEECAHHVVAEGLRDLRRLRILQHHVANVVLTGLSVRIRGRGGLFGVGEDEYVGHDLAPHVHFVLNQLLTG